MKEYVRMFPIHPDETKEISLVSEAIFDKDDAEAFAENFAHNFNAKTAVSDRFHDGAYVVFAYKVKAHLIFSAYNNKFMEYTFSNFKYETRHF